MMGLWMLLLLLLHLGNADWAEGVRCSSLPAPASVSISSFNMKHTLSFLPGPQTPSDAHFTVEFIRDSKQLWKPVTSCQNLRAGQMCNLTKVFKDQFSHYAARVQAVTATQKSNWTVSESFQPLTDSVWGPPDLSVSGCGNCLILNLALPVALENLHMDFVIHVRRTRDGARFTLHLPYSEETVIKYLQTGVEYCVTVSIESMFAKAIPSEPHCAFTSPPPPRSSLYVIFSLLGAFCALAFLLMGLIVYGSQLSFSTLKRHLPRSVSLFLLYQRGNSLSGLSDPASPHDNSPCDRLRRSCSQESDRG